MGGSVSSGRNNDELVDNLVESGLIKTKLIERVFRAVDRGTFYLPKYRESAYRDLAWRDGRIHISAPCIYTRVMEALDLKADLSFLNVGSGTGYLSSMAGLILGRNGVNHNIEIHKELIVYAKERVTQFLKESAQFDHFEFCTPKFINGNCLNLSVSDEMMFYDRIYVGAGVSDQNQEQFFKCLLKINGILVIPLNDQLVKITRLGENSWSTIPLMSVSFASLIPDTSETKQEVYLPKMQPHRLQELCRFKIRECIRRNILREVSDYFDVKREKSTFNPNLKESGEREHHNEEIYASDTEHESESPTENYPIIRIGRLFHIENHLQAQLRRFMNAETETTNESEHENENQEETEREHEEREEDENSAIQTIFQINNSETNRQVDETPIEQVDRSHSESLSDEDTIQLDFDEHLEGTSIGRQIESTTNEPSKQIDIPCKSTNISENVNHSPTESGFDEMSPSVVSNSLSSLCERTQSLSLSPPDSAKSSTSQEVSTSQSTQNQSQLDENNPRDSQLNKQTSQESQNPSVSINQNLLRAKVLELPVSKALHEFLLYYREK